MKPGRAPDYQLKEAYGELPERAFVRPIEYCYLPMHVKEKLCIVEGFYFNQEINVVCYTRLGMMVIPRDKIRQA